MMKILVSDSLSDEGLKLLKEVKDFQVDVKTGMKPDELKTVIGGYDALIVRSATKATREIIEAAKNLKVIGAPASAWTMSTWKLPLSGALW